MFDKSYDLFSFLFILKEGPTVYLISTQVYVEMYFLVLLLLAKKRRLFRFPKKTRKVGSFTTKLQKDPFSTGFPQ